MPFTQMRLGRVEQGGAQFDISNVTLDSKPCLACPLNFYSRLAKYGAQYDTASLRTSVCKALTKCLFMLYFENQTTSVQNNYKIMKKL